MNTNPKSAHIGPMSKNSVNVPHFIAPRTEFDIPTRVTNASSRDPLSLSAIWTAPHRLGSLDFLRHGSRTSFSDAAQRKQSAELASSEPSAL